jgi:hypothetical protein
MKTYSIYHLPVMAFYSKALYSDIALNWKGVCFGYLFLLLSVCWIPDMIKLQQTLNSFILIYAPDIVAQVPEIRIINGKASFNVEQPHSIIFPGTDKVFVVFDSTGKTTSPDMVGAFALVTEKMLIIEDNRTKKEQYSFDKIDDFTLNQQMINDFLTTVRKYLTLALYPLALIGSFVFRILQVLLYAAIGLLFASMCKSDRTYDSLIRLSVVAITPGLIISAILETAGIHLPFAGLWFFLMAMGFLYYGVRAAAQGEKTEMRQQS